MTSKWSINKNGTVGKICGKCGYWYQINEYYKKASMKDGLRCWCIYCIKEYRDSKHGKLVYDKWRNSKEGRASQFKYDNLRNRTEKRILSGAKRNAKRRGLGFNPVYDNILSEPYCWHHPNNSDVVAIPRDLHYLYNAYSYSLGLTGHRFMLNQIIKQIYKGDNI